MLNDRFKLTLCPQDSAALSPPDSAWTAWTANGLSPQTQAAGPWAWLVGLGPRWALLLLSHGGHRAWWNASWPKPSFQQVIQPATCITVNVERYFPFYWSVLLVLGACSVFNREDIHPVHATNQWARTPVDGWNSSSLLWKGPPPSAAPPAGVPHTFHFLVECFMITVKKRSNKKFNVKT